MCPVEDEEEKGEKNRKNLLCVCVSEFFVAQWSSMGVNVFQTANYYKLLAIRRFSYGERLVSVSCVSDASPFEWIFSPHLLRRNKYSYC